MRPCEQSYKFERLFDAARGLKLDVELAEFGLDLGPDWGSAGIVDEPDGHISLLLDQPVLTKYFGFDPPAPNLAPNGLLLFTGRNGERHLVNQSRIADR